MELFTRKIERRHRFTLRIYAGGINLCHTLTDLTNALYALLDIHREADREHGIKRDEDRESKKANWEYRKRRKRRKREKKRFRGGRRHVTVNTTSIDIFACVLVHQAIWITSPDVWNKWKIKEGMENKAMHVLCAYERQIGNCYRFCTRWMYYIIMHIISNASKFK